jgi:hypothetical protein
MFNGTPDNLTCRVCHDYLDPGAATNVPARCYRVRLAP